MGAVSYASGTSELALLGETIGDNFDRTVAAYSDRDALVDCPTGRRWTYGELARDVDVLALGLLASGVGKGDRVGIWAPNVPEWTQVQYATAKIGAILVNINPAYRVHELEYVLTQSGVRALVAVPQFKASDYAAMIGEVRPRCPELRDVLLVGSPEWTALIAREHRQIPRSSPPRSVGCPRTTRSTSSTHPAPQGSPKERRSATTTSSTTATSWAELQHWSEVDRVCLSVFPFYHCFGMVMGNLGATTHGALHGDPGAGVRGRRRPCRRSHGRRCTALYGVPTMFIAELNDPGLRVVRPVEPAYGHHGRAHRARWR